MLTLPSIAIELTPRCNQQCLYCYNAWRGDAEVGPELSTARILELVDRVLAQAKLDHFTLTGGEPFLRPDILAIIDHINGRGLPVAIISNGGPIDDAMASQLARRRVHYVQVTLCGADPAAHDAHCGHGSFDRVCAAARRLSNAGVPVGGSFLCTSSSYSGCGVAYEHMRAIGIRSHYAFNRFNPSGQAASRVLHLLPTRSQVIEALAQSQRFADAHNVDMHCTMPVPPCMIEQENYPRVRFGACSAGGKKGEYAIDTAGRLKMCTLQKDTLGSVFDTLLADLVAAEPVRQFRSAIPTFCMPCPHRETCLGGCGAAAQWVLGSANELDPFLAQHVPGSGTGASPVRVAQSEITRREIRIRIDPWYDLVYHVLTHLPIAPADASSLYDKRYIEWAAGHLGQDRALLADASLMAQLYDAAPAAYLLHAWPTLYENSEQFLQTAGRTFASLKWDSTERESLARSIVEGASEPLVEMFRAALWSELAAGYERLWQREIVASTKRYAEQFLSEITEISEGMPGLREVEWVLCLPLGTHGRGLTPLARAGRPCHRHVIAVGVHDEQRGVSASFPVIQGCHEFFVKQAAGNDDRRWSTAPGRDGNAAFNQVEREAMRLGAEFFKASPWEPAWRQWAAHYSADELLAGT